ncbi:heavy metal translocating P-type ATPase [Pseudonocardia zijingensis]|uniref:Heavy metal translocating P-type ATPase n=1 Tax=Pseudonocardia zijingensis TaxID=153376 RepID=A0ABN1P5M5_9PSEU
MATVPSSDAWRRRRERVFLAVTLGAFAAGGIAWLLGWQPVAEACWVAGTLAAVVPSLAWVVAALRRGRAGVDLLAVIALLGTLAVHEFLAGALIAVMVATGQALDSAAERRASRDLRALLEHAPRSARRRTGETAEVVPLAEVVVDDLLVVGPGEVVPVDGRVERADAVLDESVLTGEPLLVERNVGEPVRSGVVNAGSAFELRATAIAEDSTYAGIVRLAQAAGAESAPVVRLADRYAAWFLPLALAVAGLAWLASGSVVRAVAVLVVATPCPLLLAAPVAIVSGLSRASRIGVVVRSGGALENLGRARTLLMDKTGTLTIGRPSVVEVAVAPGRDPAEVLRLAAAAEQLSPHVLAEAIVTEARRRRIDLPMPEEVGEQPGRGVMATVDGRLVEVGKRAVPAESGWVRSVIDRARLDGGAVAWTAIDGELAGAVVLRDPLRRDASRTIRRLRSAGLDRVVMLTGDRAEPAREVGTVLGLDEVRANQTPADKVGAVRAERDRATTVMVGDGINDAPALAAADVGVAMGARGATASSEAADVVLTTDRLDRVADAMEIARRARRIAVQSASVGTALSLVAMAIAAGGWLPPAVGALLQEGIDVAVILNALRALGRGRGTAPTLTGEADVLAHRFAGEHDRLTDVFGLLRRAASLLVTRPGPEALDALHRAHAFLTEQLLPHERAEESELYPALADSLGGPETTATMSRMHAEIERLADRLATHLEVADSTGRLEPSQVEDVLATLYGLNAVLQLHFVQEEENYFALASDVPQEGRTR